MTKKRILINNAIAITQSAFIFGVALFLFTAILSTFITGCATTSTSAPAAPPPKYELMLSGSIDGNSFQGIGIGSSVPQHSIKIQSAIAVDYFEMQSCHRAVQFNGVISKPWWDWSKDNKSFTFPYNEAPTIEDTGDCILRFCAFSKTVGSPPSACSIVDFKSSKYTLPAKNICNGAVGQSSGTMLCHTQVGLLERVQFAEPVQILPQIVDPAGKTAPYWINKQCVGSFLDVGQTLFQYQMPEDECVVIFDQIAKPHARAKLTVIPYDQALYQQ